VFAGIEGSRPLLIEIQALVGPSPLGTPRRTVVGWDGARLAMLLAVLETRCGLVIGGRDVYLNVAGGMRIAEPAADLAVAAAVVSSSFNRPAPAAAVFFGEVGLAGEVRAVSQTEARLKEAAKLGFEQVVLPAGGRGPARAASDGLRIREIRRLSELHDLLGVDHGAPGVDGRD
jgi:DNA repair protein RadA/Sms